MLILIQPRFFSAFVPENKGRLGLAASRELSNGGFSRSLPGVPFRKRASRFRRSCPGMNQEQFAAAPQVVFRPAQWRLARSQEQFAAAPQGSALSAAWSAEIPKRGRPPLPATAAGRGLSGGMDGLAAIMESWRRASH